MTLIAHWPLDDGRYKPSSIRDIASGGSGNHDGEITDWGHASFCPGGYGGRHLGQINQDGGYVHNVANEVDLRLTGEMTITVWAKADDYFYGWGTDFFASCSGSNDGTTPNNSLWVFGTDGRKLMFQWWQSGVWLTVTTSTNVLRYQGIQHLAASRYSILSNFGIRFFVDGVMVEDLDNGGSGYLGPNDGSNCTFYIGRRHDDINGRFSMDSVRVYDDPKIESDILTIYNEEIDEAHYNVASLVGDMNESSIDYGTNIINVPNEFNKENTDYNTTHINVPTDSNRESGGDSKFFGNVIDTSVFSDREDSGWVTE